MKIFFLFTILAFVVAATAQRACICTDDYTPVCGVSGKTHSNECTMNCDGDSMKHPGPCGGSG